jgi:tetratricopeptide (TPR) repeat protein
MALQRHLESLQHAGLIRSVALEPVLEYAFRHALVQEAAYRTLVRRDRQGLHLAAGRALQAVLSPAQAQGEFAAVLAHHFAEGGDEAATLEYSKYAGDYARIKHANAEAAEHYGRALARLLARPDGASGLLDLFARRGKALEQSGQYERARANYLEQESAGRDRGDGPLELAGLVARATLHSVPNPLFEPEQGIALSEQALEMARRQADPMAEAKIEWNRMLANYFSGKPGLALGFGEQSLALALRHNLREQTAYTLNDMARVYLSLGNMDRALATLEEARVYWRDQPNLHMLAENLSNGAGFYFLLGDYDRALSASDEARAIGRAIANPAAQTAVRFTAGLVHLERGDLDAAMSTMREAIHVGENGGGDLGGLIAENADLGWAFGLLGDPDRGLGHAQRALDISERMPMMRPWAAASLARLAVERGDLEAARLALAEGYRDFDPHSFVGATVMILLADALVAVHGREHAHALERLGQILHIQSMVGGRGLQAEVWFLQACALAGQGAAGEASQALGQARAVGEALGARRILWQVLARQADEAAQAGRPAEARALRQSAREIVGYIASHAGSPDLSQSFLRLPPVRAVLE